MKSRAKTFFLTGMILVLLAAFVMAETADECFSSCRVKRDECYAAGTPLESCYANVYEPCKAACRQTYPDAYPYYPSNSSSYHPPEYYRNGSSTGSYPGYSYQPSPCEEQCRAKVTAAGAFNWEAFEQCKRSCYSATNPTNPAPQSTIPPPIQSLPKEASYPSREEVPSGEAQRTRQQPATERETEKEVPRKEREETEQQSAKLVSCPAAGCENACAKNYYDCMGEEKEKEERQIFRCYETVGQCLNQCATPPILILQREERACEVKCSQLKEACAQSAAPEEECSQIGEACIQRCAAPAVFPVSSSKASGEAAEKSNSQEESDNGETSKGSLFARFRRFFFRE